MCVFPSWQSLVHISRLVYCLITFRVFMISNHNSNSQAWPSYIILYSLWTIASYITIITIIKLV